VELRPTGVDFRGECFGAAAAQPGQAGQMTRLRRATECRAKCLAYLNAVDYSGGRITITKRGKPVAGAGAGEAAWVPIAREQ